MAVSTSHNSNTVWEHLVGSYIVLLLEGATCRCTVGFRLGDRESMFDALESCLCVLSADLMDGSQVFQRKI